MKTVPALPRRAKSRDPRTVKSPDHRYDEVVAHVNGMIDTAALRTGDKLPSVRRLAEQVGVAVGTVLHAYRLLEDAGRIEARPQSGFYVRAAPPRLPEPRLSAAQQRPTRPTTGQLVLSMSDTLANLDTVPLGPAVPDPANLPGARLNRISAAIARRSRRGLSVYDMPPGSRELREQIARHMVAAGCALSPGELITTCGCQEALALCLRAVAGSGDVIAVSTPSYYGQLQTIELLGMKALEIPTDPTTGPDLATFARRLKTGRVTACLMTTNCHNPLGFVMSDADKRRLTQLLAEHQVPLIEDDTYGDLAFTTPRPSVCKAYDRDGNVLLCSSFSKTLAPGARVGWCAPGRFYEQVRRLKFCSTIATASLPQLAIAEFLAVGGYAHHLRKLCSLYARQMTLTYAAVQQSFPAGTCATRPAGGHVLWVELPEPIDSVLLFSQAVEQKIAIAPGVLFSASEGLRNCIRLNYSFTWNPRIEHAIHTLGRLATEQLRRR